MSSDSWKAAQRAAEAAIPVLVAKGYLRLVVQLFRKAKQFAENAECSGA